MHFNNGSFIVGPSKTSKLLSLKAKQFTSFVAGFQSGKTEFYFRRVVARLSRERRRERFVGRSPVFQLGQLLLDDVPIEVAANFERVRLALRFVVLKKLTRVDKT